MICHYVALACHVIFDCCRQEDEVQEQASPESPVINTGASGGVGATPNVQDLPEHDDASDDEQGPFDGYDEDDNHGDNQVVAQEDRKSTRLNSSHSGDSRMPSSA